MNRSEIQLGTAIGAGESITLKTSRSKLDGRVIDDEPVMVFNRLNAQIAEKFHQVDKRHIIDDGRSRGRDYDPVIDTRVMELEVPLTQLMEDGVLSGLGLSIQDDPQEIVRHQEELEKSGLHSGEGVAVSQDTIYFRPQEKVRVRLRDGNGPSRIRLTFFPKDKKTKAFVVRRQITDIGEISSYDVDPEGRKADNASFINPSYAQELIGPDEAIALGKIIDNARPIKKEIEDYVDAFKKLISGLNWSAQDYLEGINAIRFMWENHHGILRESGEPFEDHPFDSAENLIRNGFTDPVLIKLLFVHDIPEDIDDYKQQTIDPDTGKLPDETYSEYCNRITDRFTPIIGQEAAALAPLMAKPKPDGSEILNPEEAKRKYYENINSHIWTRIGKVLGDRWHNVNTIFAMNKKQREKTIRETREIYFQMVEGLIESYPQIQYILDDMEVEMIWVEEMGDRLD